MLDGGATWTSALTNGGEDANDDHRLGVRGQLRWSVSDALELRLILATTREDDKQLTGDITYEPGGFVSGEILPTLQAAGVSDTCADNDPHNRRHCARTAWGSKLEVHEATLLTRYDFASGLTLSAVTSWDEYSFEGVADDVAQIAAPVLRFQNTLATKSLQQDVRVASAAGSSFDWLAGFFYFESEHERGDGGNRPMWLYDELSDDPTLSALHQALFGLSVPLPFATQGQIGTLDGRQDTDYVSLYGHTTWRPSRQIAINTGLRWQDEQKDAHVVQATNDPSASVISLVLAPAGVSAKGLHRDTRELTWSVTPQWFATEKTMLFATFAHGFKSGGFNIGFGRLPIADREFGDENVEHFEIGVKHELPAGRARLAASVFRTDHNDYQDAAFVGTQFTVGNAEKVELEGLEVEGSAALTPTLVLSFAASHVDLVYAMNTHGACSPGLAPNSRTSPGACDLSGERPINAPRLKTHLGLAYEKPVSWGDLFGRFDWSSTSEYNTSFSADPRLTQPAYDWIDLRFGARWNELEAEIWAENLTDETVASIEGVLNVYAGDQSHQSYLQAPRSWGVAFRAKIR
jgi:iron complex outermembrane receptor protein